MKRYAVSCVTLIFATILNQVTPAEAQNIPSPNGRYSIARQGSLTLCSKSQHQCPGGVHRERGCGSRRPIPPTQSVASRSQGLELALTTH
jgi:hypothetical protein